MILLEKGMNESVYFPREYTDPITYNKKEETEDE